MSKDKIEVNMNVYDIPILVEALEKANEENKRLNNIIKEVREYIEDLYDVRFTDKDKRKILEILDKCWLKYFERLQELKGDDK